ncbi:uncharacterized protein LOC135847586 isoform X1 [Planococcus citri]|uniref:uncharacterized protein LOC135847586 isoform X1 n=1 Tax=Planococcus citri TaxID=170843 RepID=UPI0031F77628
MVRDYCKPALFGILVGVLICVEARPAENNAHSIGIPNKSDSVQMLGDETRNRNRNSDVWPWRSFSKRTSGNEPFTRPSPAPAAQASEANADSAIETRKLSSVVTGAETDVECKSQSKPLYFKSILNRLRWSDSPPSSSSSSPSPNHLALKSSQSQSPTFIVSEESAQPPQPSSRLECRSQSNALNVKNTNSRPVFEYLRNDKQYEPETGAFSAPRPLWFHHPGPDPETGPASGPGPLSHLNLPQSLASHQRGTDSEMEPGYEPGPMWRVRLLQESLASHQPGRDAETVPTSGPGPLPHLNLPQSLASRQPSPDSETERAGLLSYLGILESLVSLKPSPDPEIGSASRPGPLSHLNLPQSSASHQLDPDPRAGFIGMLESIASQQPNLDPMMKPVALLSNFYILESLASQMPGPDQETKAAGLLSYFQKLQPLASQQLARNPETKSAGILSNLTILESLASIMPGLDPKMKPTKFLSYFKILELLASNQPGRDPETKAYELQSNLEKLQTLTLPQLLGAIRHPLVQRPTETDEDDSSEADEDDSKETDEDDSSIRKFPPSVPTSVLPNSFAYYPYASSLDNDYYQAVAAAAAAAAATSSTRKPSTTSEKVDFIPNKAEKTDINASTNAAEDQSSIVAGDLTVKVKNTQNNETRQQWQQPLTKIILRPKASATAGKQGIAISSPISAAYVKRGDYVEIEYLPESAANVGEGGVAISRPELVIHFIDRRK